MWTSLPGRSWAGQLFLRTFKYSWHLKLNITNNCNFSTGAQVLILIIFSFFTKSDYTSTNPNVYTFRYGMFAFQKIDSLSHASFQLLSMAKFNLTSTLSKIIHEIDRFYTRGRIIDPFSHWLVLCVKCKDGIKRVQARRNSRGEQCEDP